MTEGECKLVPSSNLLARKVARASRSWITGKMRLPLEGRGNLFEFYGDEFRDTRFLHRHAIQSARSFHCALVVRNDYELGVGGHGNNFVREAADVCFIQRRVDLVEQ